MRRKKDERVERAKALRALDCSYDFIAADIGVSQTTIMRWLSEKKQAYDKAYKKTRTEWHREYQRRRRAAQKRV